MKVGSLRTGTGIGTGTGTLTRITGSSCELKIIPKKDE